MTEQTTRNPQTAADRAGDVGGFQQDRVNPLIGLLTILSGLRYVLSELRICRSQVLIQLPDLDGVNSHRG